MIQVLAQSSNNASSGGSLVGLLLPLLLMGGVFYFLLIRPQRTRQRQQQALLQTLHVGDEVMTAGGIFGTVTALDEDADTVTLEIAPGIEIRMVRRAIAQRLSGDEPTDDDDPDDASDEEADAAP